MADENPFEAPTSHIWPCFTAAPGSLEREWANMAVEMVDDHGGQVAAIEAIAPILREYIDNQDDFEGLSPWAEGCLHHALDQVDWKALARRMVLLAHKG